MLRRKSDIITPQPTALRRSPRLLCLKDTKGRIIGSKPATSSTENAEAPRKNRGVLAPEVSKRARESLDVSAERLNLRKSPRSNGSVDGICTLRRSPRFSRKENSDVEAERIIKCGSSQSLVGSLDGVNSSIVLRKSRRLNGSIDRSCAQRRAPRFSSGGNSSDKSWENVPSDGGKSRKLILGKRKNKGVFAEGGKGEVGVASSNRICARRIRRCVLPETKSLLVAADKSKDSSFCCEQERAKIRKSIVSVNESPDNVTVSYRGREENAVNLSGRVVENLNRMVTRSGSFGSTRDIKVKEANFIGKGLEIVSGLCAAQIRLTCDNSTEMSLDQLLVEAEGEETKRRYLIERSAEKMKRKLDEEGNDVDVHGWTKEQELALQRAYFTAKPSPHFWKKVSKQVPGKSARECFDKVHSDQITPRQPQPRSRAKRTNLSPIQSFSLSASKLLKSTEPRRKRPVSNKQRRNHLAQKTIRQLLEKQCHVDQGHEMDLFSVLEPSTNDNIQSTPKVKERILQKVEERSSSGHKRPCSRFISATTLVSPPVLKQVKNKALHEKYIDQLHCREAKRKAKSARVFGKENVKPIDFQKKDSIRSAKDALVLDVKDAIDKLKGLQADNSSSSSDFAYDHGESEDEGEIDL